MLALVMVRVLSGYSQTPDAFNPNAELGSVSELAVQSDGKVLVGGLFTGGLIPKARWTTRLRETPLEVFWNRL